MKNLVIGILAHVDAGKTTLSEGLLFASGAIERQGRVDKRDSFLDTYSLERERGITIFSKQATLTYGDSFITLVDTPGHVDFSCEAERALSVQDYAILVINACDGVQSHTKTLWHLLSSMSLPLPECAWDTMIAAYLINPQEKNYALSHFECDDASGVLSLAARQKTLLSQMGMLDLMENLEMPLTRVLFSMEQEGPTAKVYSHQRLFSCRTVASWLA